MTDCSHHLLNFILPLKKIEYYLIAYDINAFSHSLCISFSLFSLHIFFSINKFNMLLIQLPLELQLLILEHIKAENHLDLAPISQYVNTHKYFRKLI